LRPSGKCFLAPREGTVNARRPRSGRSALFHPDGNELLPTAYDDTGLLISKERLREKWRRVCAAAKVEDLHVHDLRAEFASQLSESKVPVEQVRDARGHRSITMTNTCLRSRASLEDAYRKRTQHQARQRMKIVARG